MSDALSTSPALPRAGDSSTLANSQSQAVSTPWVMSMFIFLYSLIFLLGLTGNCLVAFVVMRNKAMQTITNIFITNLAISDILMCLLAVPFTPISFFLNSWIFGKALCHIVPMILCISVYVSTLTSTAIAVDRYFVIVYPFKPRMKIYMCVLMIVAIWIISISISLPLGIYHEVEKSNGSYVCSEQWPKPQARQFFTVTSLVLQYIVPCSIISFCYTMVSRALKKRSKVKIGSGARTREREEMEIKRKKRTNKMLIAMSRPQITAVNRSQPSTDRSRQKITTVNRSQSYTDHNRQQITAVHRSQPSTDHSRPQITAVKRSQPSTDHSRPQITTVNRSQPSTDHSCQQNTAVNRSQLSTDHSCQQITAVNRSQLSFSTKAAVWGNCPTLTVVA
ncbi:Neuropeptide FF receptor 2 [Bulinus truncatus]|nr:Neuropeptide FF receptor 2 [Bulinus truncatus]